MEAVEAPFVRHPKGDQHADREPYGQTKDIDERVSLLAPDAAQGDLHIVPDQGGHEAAGAEGGAAVEHEGAVLVVLRCDAFRRANLVDGAAEGIFVTEPRLQVGSEGIAQMKLDVRDEPGFEHVMFCEALFPFPDFLIQIEHFLSCRMFVWYSGISTWLTPVSQT